MATNADAPPESTASERNLGVCPGCVSIREEVAGLWEALKAVLEETTGRRVAELVQRLDATADSTERLWEAIEVDRGNAARLLHRVDRVEGAFESQWAVLRRLELEVLEIRKDLSVIMREFRRHLEVSETSRRDG